MGVSRGEERDKCCWKSFVLKSFLKEERVAPALAELGGRSDARVDDATVSSNTLQVRGSSSSQDCRSACDV